jgi:hypothetical protein
MKYSVLAMLLATSSAVKLKQLSFNNLKNRDSPDDVDPDDKDIDDGKIASKEDITIFTDSFVNHGENCKSIMAQAEHDKQAKLDKLGLDTYNNNDEKPSKSPYPLPSKKKEEK